MNKTQRPAILFQVAGLRGRVARLPRRGRLALSILGALALAWLLGLPQGAYRHLYVWLAYPIELVVDSTQTLTNPHQRVFAWGEWTRDIDARYAWLHTRAHGGLGGAIAMELLVPLVFLGVIGWRGFWFFYTRPKRLKPSTAHGSARWMTRQEMRAPLLRYTGAPLLLGTGANGSVALDRSLQVLNVLLVGPPNTGKSAAFYISNLRREDGRRSVVVTDLKNELLKKSYGALSDRHDVWVLNFLSPATSMGYNPLAYCTDPLATALFCDAWISNTGASEDDPFWSNAARELMLAGISHLQATLPGEVTLTHLDHFLTGQPPQQIIATLEESPAPLAKKKALSFMAALKANDKLLGSVFAEITPRFMILSDPRVQAVTSRNEVDFRRMVDTDERPVALFIGLDRTLQRQLKPLIAAFFLDMFRTFSQIADESAADALARDVFIYADEFGNLGAIPEMATWISTMRSAGVGMMLAVQSTKQIEAVYGEETFETITASCYTKIGLSHMSWTDAKWFSDQAGQKTEVTQSSNVQRGRFHVTTDRGGASQSETKANLVNPDEIQRIGETELVALIGERPPVRLTQRRYFADDEVKDKGGVVPPLGPARLDGPLSAPVIAAPTSPTPAESYEDEPEHAREHAPGVTVTTATTTTATTTTDAGHDLTQDTLPLGSGPMIEH